MVKKNRKGLIFGILFLVVLGMFLQSRVDLFSITGSEIITRDLPTQVENGQSVQLTYTATQTSGSWGASIVDSVTGGCTFPDGSTQYKSVMLSTDGNTKTITINTPNNEATCVFSGDYKFGAESEKNFPTHTLEVKTCNTQSDTNCDGIVDRSELGVSISKWLNGQISRDTLGEAIVAWIN